MSATLLAPSTDPVPPELQEIVRGAPYISVHLMHTSAYIRCHRSVCNGLSCFRNLTLSRSRVKLIDAGRDPVQPDWCYFLGLSGKNNQGIPVLTTAGAYQIHGSAEPWWQARSE